MEQVSNTELLALSQAIGIFKGKWKPWIICTICESENDRIRYNELKKKLPRNVTHKMLSQHLSELEQDDILLREAYDEMPPRVEYSLTEKGQSLARLLGVIMAWGSAYPNRPDGSQHIA